MAGMPWKECRAMSQKQEFVERVTQGEKVTELCREFDVSRQTGHKWVKRFKELGWEGLEEESRRPKTTPLATAEELVVATLQAREEHPRWGPFKLHQLLRRRFGEQTPSKRTIARILVRANKVRERRRRAPISVVERAPTVVAQAPNDVWTVDFKGWWRTLNGERCEPLTVRDAYSRYLLAAVVCSTKKRDVRPVFESLFRRHGVPQAIQCDNGVPFVSVQSRAGLSSLSAWWVTLGIRLVRSRPGCPQDNGAHERMHADVRADVQAHPTVTRDEQQRVIDRWRQEFNRVRPHQALDGKTPAEVYKVTTRRHPLESNYSYPKHFYVRRVARCGTLYFRGDGGRLGQAFAGHHVGIEILDAMRIRVWLHEVDLGVLETLPAVDEACFEPPAPRRRRRQQLHLNSRPGGAGAPGAAPPTPAEPPVTT
jgi:transposase InsO family protein